MARPEALASPAAHVLESARLNRMVLNLEPEESTWIGRGSTC